MGNSDPLSLPLITYAAVFIVAIGGGLVGYLNRPVAGAKVEWGQMVIVMLTSAFLGFLMFLVCFAKGWDMPWTLVAVGVVGLMGKRAILDFQNLVRLRLGLPANATEPPASDEVEK